jgi:hypothetical protein
VGSSAPKLATTTSEAGTLTITLKRVKPGGRRGRKCIVPRPARTKPCTKLVAVKGTASLQVPQAGPLGITFGGKFASKTLAAGTYRATFEITDAAGNRSAPRTATFTLA